MTVAKGDYNLLWQVIVVGSSADEFVRLTTSLLDHHGIEHILCDDVYSSIGELAKSKGPNVLVIGRFGQLSKEQGRFFHILRKRSYTCCCLVDRGLARNQKQILTALETGVFIINKPAEIEEVVVKLLVGKRDWPSEKKENCRASNFIKEEFLTTKAELDALLEVQLDEKL